MTEQKVIENEMAELENTAKSTFYKGKQKAGKVISGVGKVYKYAWYTCLGSALTVEENLLSVGKKMAAKGEKVSSKNRKKIISTLDLRKNKVIHAREDIKVRAHEKMEGVENIIDKGVNRSLHFIGVPSRNDMDQMTSLMKDMADSITELTSQLQENTKKSASTSSGASRAAKKPKEDGQNTTAA